MNESPIGVFDSGLGGLTVARMATTAFLIVLSTLLTPAPPAPAPPPAGEPMLRTDWKMALGPARP